MRKLSIYVNVISRISIIYLNSDIAIPDFDYKKFIFCDTSGVSDVV